MPGKDLTKLDFLDDLPISVGVGAAGMPGYFVLLSPNDFLTAPYTSMFERIRTFFIRLQVILYRHVFLF
jgi:hypothetical protein